MRHLQHRQALDKIAIRLLNQTRSNIFHKTGAGPLQTIAVSARCPQTRRSQGPTMFVTTFGNVALWESSEVSRKRFLVRLASWRDLPTQCRPADHPRRVCWATFHVIYNSPGSVYAGLTLNDILHADLDAVLSDAVGVDRVLDSEDHAGGMVWHPPTTMTLITP